MNEFAITFGLWWGVVLAFAAVLNLTRLARLDFKWLALAIVLHGLYFAAVFSGLPFVDFEQIIGDLQWNWDGKIAAIGLSIAALTIFSLFSKQAGFRQAGFTFKQIEGSVAPALIVTFLLVALTVGAEIAANDGADTSLERLLFQATMPGIDEEMYFRGVLLLVMGLAVSSGAFRLFGAPISWAGILVTILFGLGHSLFWKDGALEFSVVFFAITAFLGFGLLWLRERTGSIVVPLVAHNLINFTASFF